VVSSCERQCLQWGDASRNCWDSAFDVQVVTLQQSEWRRLKTKQQQVEYAWQLSQGVEVSAPGMPHLVHQVVVDKDKTSPRKTSLPKTLLRILLEGH
jgi:hypothetical protein